MTTQHTLVQDAERAIGEETGISAANPANASESEVATQVEHGVDLQHDDYGKEKVTSSEAGAVEGETSGLLSGVKLYTVFLSLMLCVFMFALDQSIVASAIPIIVSDFHAFDQVAWVVTGYFLTQCGLILLAGQLLTVLRAKWVLLAAIFFFELGSLICAVSHNMPVLIFARAIQGVGASGMFVSILAVIAVITRIDQRAAFMASFGFVFVISSVVGPLLGGVFTQRVSWRWCFWINLPFGGIAALACVLLLPSRKPARDANSNLPEGWKAVAKMDYLGSALILTTVTCLLLALQWGGNEYAWGSWRIILLFILGGLLAIVFVAWEIYYDVHALIPVAIMKNRTSLACAAAMFFYMLAMLGGTYQLPLFYEAVKGHSAEKAGIDIIPFMLSICVAIFISGGVSSKTGRYWPFLLMGPPFSAVGFGLLYTINRNTSGPELIGYQILAGFGIGLSFQMVLIAIQAEFHERPYLLPQATGFVSFFQLTGAAIGVGIINTVESVYLNKEIPLLAPDVDFNVVRQSTEAIYTLPVDQQGPVIEAYIIAINHSIIPVIIAVGIALFAGVFIRNHNMKEKNAGGAHLA
ncbi:MFS transporter, DHA2 family, glioxin efflux transporter, partial [Tremellales sp. Uapishka_1]